MSDWKYKLDVSDVFHNDDLTLAEKTEKIVRRIKLARWFEDVDQDSWSELTCALEELEDAANDPDYLSWWNAVWDGIYDIMDASRVWVVTHEAKVKA